MGAWCMCMCVCVWGGVVKGSSEARNGICYWAYRTTSGPSQMIATLKCLSIGTPKAIDFPFVSNEKLMFLGVPVF